MKKIGIFAVIALMALVSTAASYADSGKCAAGEKKSVCCNPLGDTLNKTPSIKAMQCQKARPLGYTRDVLGNKVATQTDNSGHNYLGR